MNSYYSVCLALLLLSGCATAASDTNAAQAEEPTVAEASDPQLCAEFATSMCASLEADSDACGAVQRVSRWLAPEACAAGLAHMDATLERIAALRQDCTTVGERLCAKIEQREDICTLLKEDLKAVSPEQCSKLLAEYPEVEAAFMERLKSEEPLDESIQAELVAGDVPAFGPEDAAVTIVLFSDFQCPYCAMAAETIEQIRANYGERVRVVFRHFPLPFHTDALPAAQAAHAAHAQGMFWAFHDQLFANQNALGAEALSGYAKQLGLKMKAFEKARAAKATKDAVAADMALAQKVQVRGTPTMYLNGVLVRNPLDYDAVTQLIEAGLQEGAAEAGAAEAQGPEAAE